MGYKLTFVENKKLGLPDTVTSSHASSAFWRAQFADIYDLEIYQEEHRLIVRQHPVKLGRKNNAGHGRIVAEYQFQGPDEVTCVGDPNEDEED